VAWRTEQSDAVMGSGPAVASRRPRLAETALCANYHLELESGRAPGRFPLSQPGGSGRLDGSIEAHLPFEAQPASVRMIRIAQRDAVAVPQQSLLARA